MHPRYIATNEYQMDYNYINKLEYAQVRINPQYYMSCDFSFLNIESKCCQKRL